MPVVFAVCLWGAQSVNAVPNNTVPSNGAVELRLYEVLAVPNTGIVFASLAPPVEPFLRLSCEDRLLFCILFALSMHVQITLR
jgi:hypothetical protein